MSEIWLSTCSCMNRTTCTTGMFDRIANASRLCPIFRANTRPLPMERLFSPASKLPEERGKVSKLALFSAILFDTEERTHKMHLKSESPRARGRRAQSMANEADERRRRRRRATGATLAGPVGLSRAVAAIPAVELSPLSCVLLPLRRPRCRSGRRFSIALGRRHGVVGDQPNNMREHAFRVCIFVPPTGEELSLSIY